MAPRDRAQIQDLKELTHRQMGSVLAALGIRARPNGRGLILISNPRMKDLNPSFAIWTHGGILSWKYFSGNERGDVVDLVSYLNGWWDLPDRGFVEAARWLEDHLGVRRQSTSQRAAAAAKSRATQAHDDKDAAEKRQRCINWARAQFFGGVPIAGTPVETYLRDARGIDFSLLPKGPRGGSRVPGAVRYLPDHLHYDPVTRQQTRWPCMVVPFVDMATGDVRAIHRTWLRHDGRGKAPVNAARKAFPDVAGLVLPLWKGETGLSVREAIECGLRETAVLVEGVEDGYSAVLASPQYRTWGAYSLSNLANLAPLLPECIDAVMIHRQNDWLKRQAVAAFDRARAAFETRGLLVAEIAAFGSAKDLNDMVRAG